MQKTTQSYLLITQSHNQVLTRDKAHVIQNMNIIPTIHT